VSGSSRDCTAIAPDRILTTGSGSTSIKVTFIDMAKHRRRTLEPIDGSAGTFLLPPGVTAEGVCRHGGDVIGTRHFG
jgi:hypothetical protein